MFCRLYTTAKMIHKLFHKYPGENLVRQSKFSPRVHDVFNIQSSPLSLLHQVNHVLVEDYNVYLHHVFFILHLMATNTHIYMPYHTIPHHTIHSIMNFQVIWPYANHCMRKSGKLSKGMECGSTSIDRVREKARTHTQEFGS